jgi:hypothetical protein
MGRGGIHTGPLRHNLPCIAVTIQDNLIASVQDVEIECSVENLKDNEDKREEISGR